MQRSIKLNEEQSIVKIQLELPQIQPLQSKPSTDTEALDQVQLERLNFTDLPSIYKRHADESWEVQKLQKDRNMFSICKESSRTLDISSMNEHASAWALMNIM